jgi:hypothetical protein
MYQRLPVPRHMPSILQYITSIILSKSLFPTQVPQHGRICLDQSNTLRVGGRNLGTRNSGSPCTNCLPQEAIKTAAITYSVYQIFILFITLNIRDATTYICSCLKDGMKSLTEIPFESDWMKNSYW